MIGLWHTQSGTFLKIAAVLTVLFAAPMFFVPLRWARALGWALPESTDLAVYFGRCLGGVVTVLAIFGWAAADSPAVQPFYFELMLSVVAMNVSVHIYGGIKRIQPKSETWETLVWVAILIAGLLFFPT